MSARRMRGTPWHTERLRRSEGDDRRYKGRCKYYQYDGSRCSYYCAKCTGSAHCSHYKAISDIEFEKKRSKASAVKKNSKNNDDIYWY